MLDYIYAKDVEATQSIPVPKWLFSNPKFAHIPANARVLYALLLEVSKQNLPYTLEDIREDFCYSESEAREMLRELDSADFIDFGPGTTIYVNDVEIA